LPALDRVDKRVDVYPGASEDNSRVRAGHAGEAYEGPW
jgi:hypothetical protein